MIPTCISEFSNSAKEKQGSEGQESAVKVDMLQEEEESRMNGHSAVEVLRRENRALRQQASKLEWLNTSEDDIQIERYFVRA